jgi:hypothetical protein
VRVALDVGARADCRVEYVLTLKGDELAGPALYAATGKKKCPAAETLQFQIQKKHIVRPLP